MTGNIFTDYYKAQLLTTAKCRYDVMLSTQSYPLFESLFINKQKFNVGGLSFYYGPRPSHFKANAERLTDMAITKGSTNVTSVFVPNLSKNYLAYGDMNNTTDALIILFDEGKNTIEIFIARGYLFDKRNLFDEVASGNLDAEMDTIRLTAVNVFKG
jgi:hypothetical protein